MRRFNPETGQMEEVPNPPSEDDLAREYNSSGVSTTSFDSLTPTEINPFREESSEDVILRLIRDQLSGARARYNRLGITAGATEQQLAAALDPLRGQLDQLDSQKNALRGLTGELIGSSIAGNTNASLAAVNAARLSGGGRYGSGGAAAVMASRGAVDAAVGSSSAISQALVQGRLGEAQYQAGILQTRGGIAAALSQLLQEQAGLREERGKLGVAMESESAQILASGLNAYAGIREAREQKDPKAKFPDLLGII